jgi:hypothetical protein
MTTQIITPTDSPDNLNAWIADVQDFQRWHDDAHPSGLWTVSSSDVMNAIPVEMWSDAYLWREAEFRVTMATAPISTRIIHMFDAAQTVVEVNRVEEIVLRWMDAAMLDRPDTEWIHYRAKWRRDEILSGMDYPKYLQTDHWQGVRKIALERASGRCCVCNSESRLDVHHRTYERRGYELPEDVIVLCRKCHEIFHKNGRLAR